MTHNRLILVPQVPPPIDEDLAPLLEQEAEFQQQQLAVASQQQQQEQQAVAFEQEQQTESTDKVHSDIKGTWPGGHLV